MSGIERKPTYEYGESEKLFTMRLKDHLRRDIEKCCEIKNQDFWWMNYNATRFIKEAIRKHVKTTLLQWKKHPSQKI